MFSTLPDNLWLPVLIMISSKKGGAEFWEQIKYQFSEQQPHLERAKKKKKKKTI